jgi:hypothetical protein
MDVLTLFSHNLQLEENSNKHSQVDGYPYTYI